MIKNMKGQDMATTPKKQAAKPAAKETAAKAVAVSHGKTEAEKNSDRAALLVSPEFAAYRVISGIDKPLMGETDVKLLVTQLREYSAAANSGDLTRPEAMQMNQATALQSLFAGLTEKAMNQSHMPNIEGFMKLALRAQSQCRATLETLAAIKKAMSQLCVESVFCSKD